METIGILYSYRAGTPRLGGNVQAKLHINYWKIDNNHRYADFGLMLSGDYEHIESIWFYFPFELSVKSLSDLGHRIDNVEMLNAIFNADYSVQQIPQSSYVKVISNPNDDDKSFLLYKLGEDNFFVDSSFSNQLLEIKINSTPPKSKGGIKLQNINDAQNNDPEELDLYFRFRVQLPKNSFYRQTRITNDVFQSAFSKSEVLDIRINDKRDINYSKLEKVSEGRVWFVFDKVHFYYCGPTIDEQVLGSKPYQDCRLVDSTVWSTYLDSFNSKKGKYLAFHWKTTSASKPLHTYSLFVKTIFQSTNVLQIVLYVVIVIALGFIGSFLSGLIR